MQSNIFMKVAPSLKELPFNCDDVLTFLDVHYHAGDWIYPGVITRNTPKNMKEVYQVLEKCCELGLLKKFFDIYCPFCCRFTGCRYDEFLAIPEIEYCPHCDREITNCFEDALIIYKVLENG